MGFQHSNTRNYHMSKKNPKTGLSGLVLLGIVLETNWGCRYFKQKHKLCFLSFASLIPFSGIFLVEVFCWGFSWKLPRCRTPCNRGSSMAACSSFPSPCAGAKTAKDFWLFGGREEIGTLLKKHDSE